MTGLFFYFMLTFVAWLSYHCVFPVHSFPWNLLNNLYIYSSKCPCKQRLMKQIGSISPARVGVSMRGCEGSGQPGVPGVRGHAHQTACSEWLSSTAQRACQSRLIMRSGWFSPSLPGWSDPPRPSFHPYRKRKEPLHDKVVWISPRKKRKRNKESLWGPTIPKGWTLGIKERLALYGLQSIEFTHNIYPTYYALAFSLQNVRKSHCIPF